MNIKPSAILIHVPNVSEGLAWYQHAFPSAVAQYLPDFNFTLLHIGDFTIEVVQADSKVSAGKKGTVLYWQVDDFNCALTHFQKIGATLYRGPMEIDNGFYMCQVEDPFGNLIGLKGQKA
ncbi:MULTISPECIES: VOC family protein [Enterobacterales]|uniref:VOC family protein n=1 Tax=Enterobacterales TaxID=91347 RepID=UPI000B0C0AA0|nr:MULTISPECIES: VOC family protein [Enterobacterales]MCT6518282.1 glyoxalase/bleomycin resistance/dioxygenase family protein [Proteus vulgaris]WOO48328.1 glyoxalase/bleomycin resistance/dioxygenase family protein [Hafnia alvei]WPF02793.1 glyoxalase/bleomycin resistance/dioxygenase family protein [Proteus vulgaris]